MGTVMFGRAHDQPGILIEPNPQHAIDVEDQQQVAELRNKLMSVFRSEIDEADKVAPSFGRIFKEMILITSKSKPLPRTGKGTVTQQTGMPPWNRRLKARM